jgi:hypothetical protein
MTGLRWSSCRTITAQAIRTEPRESMGRQIYFAPAMTPGCMGALATTAPRAAPKPAPTP